MSNSVSGARKIFNLKFLLNLQIFIFKDARLFWFRHPLGFTHPWFHCKRCMLGIWTKLYSKISLIRDPCSYHICDVTRSIHHRTELRLSQLKKELWANTSSKGTIHAGQHRLSQPASANHNFYVEEVMRKKYLQQLHSLLLQLYMLKFYK
jgi:hypothetical protein